MYYAKVFKEDLGRGLEILSDILMNSLIDANAVHRERDVILREMEEVNKQQEEVRVNRVRGRKEGGTGHIRGKNRNTGQADRQTGIQAQKNRGTLTCVPHYTQLHHSTQPGRSKYDVLHVVRTINQK